MIESLFGCRSAAHILLYLFVNGKCYGTELHRTLQTALTPLQKTLQRLERDGIIMSHYEGKTRVYQFHPGCPLLEELEALLKKAFILLPQEEKMRYSATQGQVTKTHSRDIIKAVWKKLGAIKKVAFHAQSRSKEELGWNGKGTGKVHVTQPDEKTIIFKELGSWDGRTGQEMNFSNVFRWTLNEALGTIALEHLRRGANAPVFLFNLAPSGKESLSSVGAHQCEGDTYFGELLFSDYNLRLNWRIIGKKKNEEIDYVYSK